MPFQYIKCLNRRFGNKQLVTTDVGQHQLWVANYYDFSAPDRFLSSCGLGAMGFGIGAAAGAAIATGERVLYVTGDGSFNMCFNELATIVKYNLPVTIIIMNNSSLGMIREVQKSVFARLRCPCAFVRNRRRFRRQKSQGARAFDFFGGFRQNDKLDPSRSD